MKTAKQISLLERYRSFIDLPENSGIVTLKEGNTPLVYLQTISDPQKGIAVYAKCEGANPTGSFKDRGMTLAVTIAVSEGAGAIICASTGNTSASAAAYAARCGIAAYVIIPDGKIALGKLAQAMMHGAKVIQISGNFDTGMELVKQMAGEGLVTLVNSINPHRLHGQKTAAFEIIDELKRAPDYHFLPVGNAGNISAYWIGYSQYMSKGLSRSRPIMVGCQAFGAAPFVAGNVIDEPDTIATAIRIGKPQSWDYAIKAKNESGGWFRSSTDDQIIAAQKHLAENEGIFCEPASAVCVAGLIEELERGGINEDSTIVCTLTGHGLKDPDVAIQQSQQAIKINADYDSVRGVILTDSE
ncbi:MAG: threonine synthase [Acidiferrobacteraceae bacterium]|nr:threonine synthase [Acidiferrobacteraceae bacterium]|tara:strand:- start:10625 stop:11695 length:1071 start_codon:yes stop_codon:yes gene_type:complete